jgi:hypothetical protein
LTAALKALVAAEKLTGAMVRFSLSGEFCVTRVLTGTADRVRRELKQLEDRSQRYLTLGTGEKALAGSIRQIDARHQHALLTVTNQKTLETLMHVATTVGIKIDRVEPSLVALCRVIGQLEYDKNQPTMILQLDEKGVELGISHGGQLLLDYRPGGREVHDEVADIVAQHLARLQRYCFRYFRFAQGELNKIFLCGTDDAVEKVRAGFAKQPQLQVEVLNLAALEPRLRFSSGTPSSDLASAVGTCLIPVGASSEEMGPNLIEDLQDFSKKPLVSELMRIAWPLAATVVIVLAALGVKQRQQWAVTQLEAEIAALQPKKLQSLKLRSQLATAKTKQAYLGTISESASCPDWSRVVSIIAGCMPEDVWLDSFHLDEQGRVKLAGMSYAEDGIYEFVSWLKKSPLFFDVALEGTRSGRFEGGQVIQFDLMCNFNGTAGLANGEISDD